MGLLFLLFPFAEIYAFFSFVDEYSFFDALLGIFLAGIFGMIIMRMIGKATLGLFQAEVAQGKIPGKKILHGAAIFLGGLFLFIPGFISDVIGVLFILPGSRHLVVMYMKSLLARGVLRGRVFMGGMGGGFGMPGDFQFRRHRGPGAAGGPHSRGPQWEEPRVERDAQVIDIDPIEITHTPKKNDSNS